MESSFLVGRDTNMYRYVDNALLRGVGRFSMP